MGQRVVASGETPTQLGTERNPELDVEASPRLLLVGGVYVHHGHRVAREHPVGVPRDLVQKRMCYEYFRIGVRPGLEWCFGDGECLVVGA